MRRALEGSPLRCFKRTTPPPLPRHAVPVRQQIGSDFFQWPLPRGKWAPSHLQRWVLGCGTECPQPLADSGTVTTCPAGPRCDNPLEICRFGSALRSAAGRTRPTGAPSSSRAQLGERDWARDVVQDDQELHEGGRPGDLLPREGPLPPKDGPLPTKATT